MVISIHPAPTSLCLGSHSSETVIGTGRILSSSDIISYVTAGSNTKSNSSNCRADYPVQDGPPFTVPGTTTPGTLHQRWPSCCHFDLAGRREVAPTSGGRQKHIDTVNTSTHSTTRWKFHNVRGCKVHAVVPTTKIRHEGAKLRTNAHYLPPSFFASIVPVRYL